MKIRSWLYTANSTDKLYLEDTYKPLKVLEGNDFCTNELPLDIHNPVDILISPSYDGSVNLMLTDNKHVPRIINSGFAKKENNQCEYIKRYGKDKHTNNYIPGIVESQTRLFTSIDIYPTISLQSVSSGGNLQGGNYTFYFKYADADDNLTDFVGESGIVSIFNGNWNDLSTITGTLLDEHTDKCVTLRLTNVDTRFSKVYVYFIRHTSDLDGAPLDRSFYITKPYDLNNQNSVYTDIVITGYEEFKEISKEELNIQYYVYNSAKTQAINQNMLFFGNLSTEIVDSEVLNLFSKEIKVRCVQKDTIGCIDINSFKDNSKSDNPGEYYNPHNIYDRLGYWPDEFYRFGIVYIFNDGSISKVYNLKGGWIDTLNSFSFKNGIETNDFGIFRTPEVPIIPDYDSKSSIKPLAFEFQMPEITKEYESFWNKISSYFFVRQTRIPNIIAQGFSVGVNRTTGVPTPYVYDDGKHEFVDNTDNNWERSTHKFIRKPISGSYYQCESFIAHQWEQHKETLGGNGHGNASGHGGKYPWFLGARFAKAKSDGADLTNDITRRIIPIYSNKTILSDTDKGLPNNADNWDKYFWNEYVNSTLHYGLLCLEASCVPQVQSLLSGLQYYVKPVMKYIDNDGHSTIKYNRTRIPAISNYKNYSGNSYKVQLNYLGDDTSGITISKYKERTVNFKFATKIGDPLEPQLCGDVCVNIDEPNLRQYVANMNVKDGNESMWAKTDSAASLVRGYWAPFVAMVPEEFDIVELKTNYPWDNKYSKSNTTYWGKDYKTIPSTIYNIYSINLSEDVENKYNAEIQKRSHDNSSFFAVSDRVNTKFDQKLHRVYRGDCFTSTVSFRMQRNFTDPEIALSDYIVDERTWALNFNTHWNVKTDNTVQESKINRADINSIQLGYWIHYKCLSNYNLGLRSEDKSFTEEINKIGNHRSFYPVRGYDTSSACKLPESFMLNLGYSQTLPSKKYFKYEESPYYSIDYSNRIAFSNVAIDKAFTNNYRIFQNISYQDIDSSYGSITKILPYKSDLFCVFEHGCGIVPVNEKVLLQTTTQQNVHISSLDLIGKQVTIISPDYGSTWADSIIKTPNGIYGVDTSCNKLWKFNGEGFLLISDLCVQKFLNDNMCLISNKLTVGVNNVKTHYNNHKNDVMFTFYSKDKIWNLCYNEILERFICKYTWTPLLSENIDNSFYSFDLSPDDLIYRIYKHEFDKNGNCAPTFWYGKQHQFEFEFVVSEPIGVHKIFDNLQIISNNVEPNSLSFEIVGDSYSFKLDDNTSYPTIKLNNVQGLKKSSEPGVIQLIEKITDSITGEKMLKIEQKCLNIKSFGRRIGNIEYKEDKWYTVISPIYLKQNSVIHQTKIRDKYVKVRIKYSGEKLAVITSIQTLIRLSYV